MYYVVGKKNFWCKCTIVVGGAFIVAMMVLLFKVSCEGWVVSRNAEEG